MSNHCNIVNMNEVEWQAYYYSEHDKGWSKRLSPALSREKNHLGVKVDRLQPRTISGAFHYHLYEDEFCLILRGRAILRYGEKTIEVSEGDAISFPRGEQIAHQFYNHTEEMVDILMMGENIEHDLCYYPDANQWEVKSIRQVGQLQATNLRDREPDPPIIKSQQL
jgi:uncharacterized cupin superfamily protein